MSRPQPPLERPGDYIEGRFVQPAPADGELAIYSPADRALLVSTHATAISHVDRAAAAARAAFPAWRRTPESERRAILKRYQEQLRRERDAIAHAIALEVGKPRWEALAEVDAMIAKVDISLGEGARFCKDERIETLPGEIRFRPLGALAVIGPFNFPGHLPNGQIVPALLLGNCVVHKPSEKTPSAGTWIARCLDAAGLPAGVFNLVQGSGATGQALSVHPEVDGVLFTGSLAVGRQIVRDNADHPERLVALELGGKNAAIALDDCELERTARAVAFAAFATTGQRCSSTSRLIATPATAEALFDRIREIALGLRIGFPLDDVFMGPMISQKARIDLLAAQARARGAGFEALAPGGALELSRHDGFYVRPALHRAHTATVEVAGYTDAELFGPDLALYVADDLDAAIELANATRFGLAASVFTASETAFEHAAERLRVGVVHWNRASAGASSRLPFGGIKQSGNHRPAGVMAATSCAFPQAILGSARTEGPLPSWPGFPG